MPFSLVSRCGVDDVKPGRGNPAGSTIAADLVPRGDGTRGGVSCVATVSLVSSPLGSGLSAGPTIALLPPVWLPGERVLGG